MELDQIMQFLILKSKILLIILFSIIGAIVGFMRRKKQSIKQYIITLISAAFIGWICGAFAVNYLSVNNEVVYAICAVIGHFSDAVFEEIKKIISMISPTAEKLVDKYL